MGHITPGRYTKRRSKKIRHIEIYAKEYFDKTYGNTYFSARVLVNDEEVLVIPMQSGYGDHYITVARQELVKLEILPEKNVLFSHLEKDMGFKLFTSKLEGRKYREVEDYGKKVNRRTPATR